jgi:molybdopterin synthase sulfur carrier subunit
MTDEHTQIRVLFFSLLREIVGADELAWPWPPESSPATVRTLLDSLFSRFPGLEAWRDRLLVAVDLEYATPSQPIRPGQEVALMPPVQGG